MKKVDIYTAKVEDYDSLFMNRELNALMDEVCEVCCFHEEPEEDHLLRDGDEVYGGWLIMQDKDNGMAVKVEIYYNEVMV